MPSKSTDIVDIKAPILQRIRVLSYVLDRAIPIPGTKFRFGLDPVLGLIPVAGDVMGAVLSTYILIEAARFGLPKLTLLRMVFNILCETVIGIVPLFGSIFDAAWKANTRNLVLLEAHLNSPDKSRAADKWFFILLLVGLAITFFAILILGAVLIVLLLRALLGLN